MFLSIDMNSMPKVWWCRIKLVLPSKYPYRKELNSKTSPSESQQAKNEKFHCQSRKAFNFEIGKSIDCTNRKSKSMKLFIIIVGTTYLNYKNTSAKYHAVWNSKIVFTLFFNHPHTMNELPDKRPFLCLNDEIYQAIML